MPNEAQDWKPTHVVSCAALSREPIRVMLKLIEPSTVAGVAYTFADWAQGTPSFARSAAHGWTFDGAPLPGAAMIEKIGEVPP